MQNLTWISDKWWVIQLFVIVLGTLLLHYIESRIYKRIYPKLQKTSSVWDDALLFSLHKPVGFLIWALGLTFALAVVAGHAKDSYILNLVAPIRNMSILVLFIWFLIRLITCIENNLTAKKKLKPHGLDITTTHAICQLFRASIVITGALIALQMFGVPISGVWAFGGFGGLTVGFAAKDLLANFFGGLMIYLDRPFVVGEWIRSPDKEIEGVVEHIGWRLTKIRTFDKRPLFVPNGMFSTISVENPSRMSNRRIKTIINLRYDDVEKIPIILQDVENMLKAHPEIDTKQTLMVNLVECATWSLNFMIYTFTKTTNWAEYQKVRQDIFIKVLAIVAAHNAECAFPTSTIHIPEGIDMYQQQGK